MDDLSEGFPAFLTLGGDSADVQRGHGFEPRADLLHPREDRRRQVPRQSAH